MIHDSLISLIGNTPLVKLPTDNHARVYAKLEHLNPGGSIKDRTAWYMITQAEKKGLLKPGGTIIESSSGNQGISAAMIGAALGYKVIITVSEKVSKEKYDAIKAYGAEVIICPATKFLDDPEGYVQKAFTLHKNTPNSFMLNQYFNQDNAEAHYYLTGPEIWRQTNGKITHLCAAAGSGGTVSGIGKYLKEQNPAIKVLAVDSLCSYRTTKGNPQPYYLDGMGVDHDSPLLHDRYIDEYVLISDKQAHDMLKLLARKYGFLVGPASGGAASAALTYAPNLKPDDLMVTLFTDSGRAYLTKQYYY